MSTTGDCFETCQGHDDGPIGEVPPAVLAYETRLDVTRAEIVRLTGERNAAVADRQQTAEENRDLLAENLRLMTTLHECERQYQAKVNDVLAEMTRANVAAADYRYALSERDALAARLRAVEALRDEWEGLTERVAEAERLVVVIDLLANDIEDMRVNGYQIGTQLVRRVRAITRQAAAVVAAIYGERP